jgi:Protein of unknown function (DUF3467)
MKDAGVPGDPYARYANYVKVGHNAVEFLIDFGQFYSDSVGAAVHTRIVTNPIYAKAFLVTLTESVEAYERQYGEIHAD